MTTEIKDFPADKVEAAREALAKIQTRLVRAAAKAGTTAPAAPVLAVVAERVFAKCSHCGIEADAGRGGDVHCVVPAGYFVVRSTVDLALDAPKPALAGWEFLAVVEPLEGGNLIRKVPGADTEGFSFDPWRTAAIKCDHCATARRRNETFVVRADGSDPAIAAGTTKQVGRSCLADFLGGKSAAAVIAALTFVAAVREAGESESGGGHVDTRFVPATYLAWTTAAVRLYGWVSKAAANADETLVATATAVNRLLSPPSLGDKEWSADRAACTPTEADVAKGAAALAWALALPGASDYEQNLTLVAKQTVVTSKHSGSSPARCRATSGQSATTSAARARRTPAPPARTSAPSGPAPSSRSWSRRSSTSTASTARCTSTRSATPTATPWCGRPPASASTSARRSPASAPSRSTRSSAASPRRSWRAALFDPSHLAGLLTGDYPGDAMMTDLEILRREGTALSIADLVELDYDGDESVTLDEARDALLLWRRNNPSARALIDLVGMDLAVTDYVAAWRVTHDDEYGLDERGEA